MGHNFSLITLLEPFCALVGEASLKSDHALEALREQSSILKLPIRRIMETAQWLHAKTTFI